jgi:hypothetical protein
MLRPGSVVFLVEGPALQVRYPVIEEIVRLRFIRVRTDGPDDIGQLGILVRIVQLADTHLASRVTLRVVRGAVVDADHRGLQRRKHQLAGTPCVFESSSRTTVVEGRKDNTARAILVEHLLHQAGI